MTEIAFELNGRKVVTEAGPSLTLADLLRSSLGACSVHLGCEQGVCGACTVLVDDKSVRSCLMLAVQAEDRRITTAEGVAERHSDLWETIESTFVSEGAFQCGYCTSGMIVSLSEILDQGARLTRSELVERLSGQICRCTGYAPIRAACELILAEAGLFSGEEER